MVRRPYRSLRNVDQHSEGRSWYLFMFIHKYDNCHTFVMWGMIRTESSNEDSMGLHKSDVLVIEQYIVLLLACVILFNRYYSLLFLKCPRLNPPSPRPRPL